MYLRPNHKRMSILHGPRETKKSLTLFTCFNSCHTVLRIQRCAGSSIQPHAGTELGSYGEPGHCHSHSRATPSKRSLPGHPGPHSEHWLEEFYPVASRNDGPRSTVTLRRSMKIQTFLCMLWHLPLPWPRPVEICTSSLSQWVLPTFWWFLLIFVLKCIYLQFTLSCKKFKMGIFVELSCGATPFVFIWGMLRETLLWNSYWGSVENVAHCISNTYWKSCPLAFVQRSTERLFCHWHVLILRTLIVFLSRHRASLWPLPIQHPEPLDAFCGFIILSLPLFFLHSNSLTI